MVTKLTEAVRTWGPKVYLDTLTSMLSIDTYEMAHEPPWIDSGTKYKQRGVPQIYGYEMFAWE